MKVAGKIAAALMSRGVISRGWYSVLTGVAMLLAVWLIAPASDSDPAVPVVVLVLALTGIWSIERGLRAEYQRRPKG
jgi:hypothetical protein